VRGGSADFERRRMRAGLDHRGFPSPLPSRHNATASVSAGFDPALPQHNPPRLPPRLQSRNVVGGSRSGMDGLGCSTLRDRDGGRSG